MGNNDHALPDRLRSRDTEIARRAATATPSTTSLSDDQSVRLEAGRPLASVPVSRARSGGRGLPEGFRLLSQEQEGGVRGVVERCDAPPRRYSRLASLCSFAPGCILLPPVYALIEADHVMRLEAGAFLDDERQRGVGNRHLCLRLGRQWDARVGIEEEAEGRRGQRSGRLCRGSGAPLALRCVYGAYAGV